MKLFARMIAIVLVLGLLAPCIGAAEETLPFTYTIENGEVTLTSYTGPDSGTVVIPDEIEGLPVTTFGANLLNRYSELKFNLPKHLKRLEKFALPLTHDIYLPATVTELAPYCLTGKGTLSCEKYSAADQYARTFGYKANYTGEVPGVREVEADGFTFWIQNGEATLVNSISEEKYTLYVPAYIGEYPVTRIASYVTPYSVEDSYTQNIYTSIVVPATVKQIDSYAFYNRNQYRPLRSVFLCEGVETVGDYAFYDSDTSIGNFIYLTLPDSLQEFGKNEKQLNNAWWIYIYAAAGSAGAEYAQRAQATYINNHDEEGAITGNYANIDFHVQDGEATIFDGENECGAIDPFLPSYIDTYPVTQIEPNALHDVREDYAVIPPTVTDLGDDCFGNVASEHKLLLYYPGSPAEELVRYQRFPYANIYDLLAVPFDDVSDGSWYYSAVSFAYYNGLMNGVATGKFDPEGTMTRAMLVTVLYRLDGGEAVGTSPFTDVPENEWYTEGVIWANENGIVNGIGGGKFDPDGRVTREQIATILYRFAKYHEIDVGATASLSRFADSGRVSAYANAPMQWAVQSGIIGGRQEGSKLYLAPQSSGTRAEVAAILMRFLTQ